MRFTCTRCQYATNKKKLFLCHIMRKNPCGQFDENTIKDVVLKDYNKFINELHEIIEVDCECTDELTSNMDKITALLKKIKFVEPIIDMHEFEQLNQLCYDYAEKQKLNLLHL